MNFPTIAAESPPRICPGCKRAAPAHRTVFVRVRCDVRSSDGSMPYLAVHRAALAAGVCGGAGCAGCVWRATEARFWRA